MGELTTLKAIKDFTKEKNLEYNVDGFYHVMKKICVIKTWKN